MEKGRFAPSPSGRMHLGNIYTALLSWLSIKKKNGAWLLRIEDLDKERCKEEYSELILDDLKWLGLDWDEGPLKDSHSEQYFHSNRNSIYEKFYSKLVEQNLVYDCFCRRADLLALSAPQQSKPQSLANTMHVYSGKCKNLLPSQKEEFLKIRKPSKRFCVKESIDFFKDGHYGIYYCNLTEECGDFIIRRADGSFSYQLAVVIDDALMGVTEVVRGNDLLFSTFQQRALYTALNFVPPNFFHVPLLLSDDGRRLSKRDKDIDMSYFRKYTTPQALIGKIMFICGFINKEEPLSLKEALSIFDFQKLPKENLYIT